VARGVILASGERFKQKAVNIEQPAKYAPQD
jgi:hypothetical protein